MKRAGFLLFFNLFLAGWIRPHAAEDKIKVFVSILPEAYFVERIGDAQVDANVMVGPGQNPHAFEPTPKLMAQLSKAAIYFRIGVPFEDVLMKRLQRSNPSMKIVDLREGIKLLPMIEHHHEEDAENHPSDEHATGSNEKDEEAQEGAKDPHIWLSPKLAKIQSQTIAETLAAFDPNHAEEYRSNLKKLLGELDRLDEEITKLFQNLRERRFMVYHPAWGYFADAYTMEQIPIEMEGKEPTAKQLVELIELAKSQNIKIIFVQKQFSANNAKTVAKAIGGQVVSIDPLAKDYFTNMRATARALYEALK
ncbi:MAG: zinc ABC transporter substrate-binding protein [Candidatus Omnitrophota bacterium]